MAEKKSTLLEPAVQETPKPIPEPERAIKAPGAIMQAAWPETFQDVWPETFELAKGISSLLYRASYSDDGLIPPEVLAMYHAVEVLLKKMTIVDDYYQEMKK